MNLLLLLPEIVVFKKERAAQQQYLKNIIQPEIERLENEWGASLDKYLKHKIFNYYGLYVPVVIGKSFARLYGRELSAKEHRLLTLLGIVTPFFDDFFDIERLDEKEIRHLVLHPFEAKPATLMQKAFVEYGKEIVSTIPDKEFFYEVSMQVFAAQLASNQQEDPAINIDTNKMLASRKGGSSLLFYYTALDVPRNESIQQMVYHTGALLQLSNDIFDAYKDIQKNIYTLVRNYEDISDLKQYYKEQYQQLIRQTNALHVPKQQANKYLRRSQLLFAMTFVMLNRLIAVQKRKDLYANWQAVPRQELVCDAEKLFVQMKWLNQLLFL